MSCAVGVNLNKKRIFFRFTVTYNRTIIRPYKCWGRIVPEVQESAWKTNQITPEIFTIHVGCTLRLSRTVKNYERLHLLASRNVNVGQRCWATGAN